MTILYLQQFRRSLVFVLFLCLISWTGVPQARAQDAATAAPQLSLNQAMEQALEINEAVRKAGKEIDRTKVLRKNASDNMTYEPTGLVYDAVQGVNWASLLASDLSWRMSSKSLTVEQDTVALGTCQKYWTVLADQEALNDAKVSLNTDQVQLQKARAAYQAGLLIQGGQAGLLAAETQTDAAQAAYNSAQNDLTSAYNALNQAVGLESGDRPVLTDEIAMAPLQVDNLDTEVHRVLDGAPSIWLADQNVDLQKQLANVLSYTGQYQPYEARQISVDQAKLDAAGARKAFDLATRALYYEAKDLEEKYATVQQQVYMNEESLRVTQAELEVGIVTVADVAVAEKSLADAKSNLATIASNHAYLKLAFEKPWAVSSASSSSFGSTATSSS